MQMGEEVFICYSRKDGDFVHKLESRLERFGVRIWRDKRSIPAGEFWDSFIEEAIKQCNRFLLVLSSSCIESENVKKEIDVAVSSDRLIVPIRIDGCEIPDPVKEKKHNCIDFSPADLERDSDSFRLLLEGLGRLHPPESNLFRSPAQISSPPRNFTGREKELADLFAQFKDGAAVIALRGMGGIGKTAVACKITEQLRDFYPDGQILVELDGTSKAPMKPSDAMARIIHSYDAGARLPDDDKERSNFYRTFLNKKRALILLDNALDDRQVQPLLPPPESSVIVTSRQELSLPTIMVDFLEPVKSIELLKAILAEKRAIKQEYESSLAEIARLCAYLPLALRLAGTYLANTRDLDPEDYASSLWDERRRLEHIDKGCKGSGEISVQASLHLSYSRLSAEAAAVFRMLSVFPADFDSGAEEVICQDDGHEQLSELLRWSLVDYQEEAKRYRLHDLVRIFSSQRLLEVDGEDVKNEVKQRHAEHFRDVLSSATDLYENGDVLAGLNAFDLEMINIESAWDWAKENLAKSDAAASICSSFLNWPYLLYLRQHPKEHISWLQTALSASRRLNDRRAEGVHLCNLGIAYTDLGDIRKAIECYEQSLAINRKIGDRETKDAVLGNLGNAYATLGNTRKAIDYYEQALAIARGIGDRRGEGAALSNLGSAYATLGNTHTAIDYYEQRIAIAREIGDRIGESAGLSKLGNAQYDLGDIRRAFEYYEQSLAIDREIGDRRGEGNALGRLGNAYYALGDTLQAIKYYEEHLAITREIGDRMGEGADLSNLGSACIALGDPRKAIEYYEQSLAIDREIGDRKGEGGTLGNLGCACADLGDTRKAIEYYEQALSIDRETGSRNSEEKSLGNLGNAYYALGDVRQAIDYFEQSLSIAREIGNRMDEGNSLGNLGNCYCDLGDARKAIDYHNQRLVIAREIGDRRGERISLNGLGQAFEELGDARKAIEYYEQSLAFAREIGDRRGEAFSSWNLGLAYEKAGDLRRASEMMQICVSFEREIGHPNAEKHAEHFQAIRDKLKD